MAKIKFWLGMLVLVLVFGMAAVGCDNGTGTGDSGDRIIVRVTDIPSHFDGRRGNIILPGLGFYGASGAFGTIRSGTLELLMLRNDRPGTIGSEALYESGNSFVILSIISEPGNIIWYGETNNSINISPGINNISFNAFRQW